MHISSFQESWLNGRRPGESHAVNYHVEDGQSSWRMSSNFLEESVDDGHALVLEGILYGTEVNIHA